MRPISREDAIRLCRTHAVVVEYDNGGIRSARVFDPTSPFYLSSGPYDYRSARYFLANGSGGRGLVGGQGPARPKPKPRDGAPEAQEVEEAEGTEAEPDHESWEEQPVTQEAPEAVTVKITAEDGKSPPPKGILPGTALKLKAVPSRGGGAYSWKARTKAIRIENHDGQIVTLHFQADQKEAPGGETVELIFTPAGKPALAPQTHTLAAVRALFMRNEEHPWGYDEYSEIEAKDQNGTRFRFKPDSKLDVVSIRKGKTGKVDVHYTGAEGKDLFFKPLDASALDCRPGDATKNPIVLELEGKSGKYKETRLQVLYGGESGPVLAEIDVAVITAVQYRAKYFRVEDPDSPGTGLKVAATTAQFQDALKRIFNPGAAEWIIEGEPGTVKSKYDIIKNGALDIEPGADSAELKQLMADCKYKGTRIVHVHALRWSYFLAADAGPKDTRIKLKDYGRYLDFVGTNEYVLEDTSGKSVRVKIKSADRAKAEFELAAPLGVALKTSDKAALLWPLGGLSGDPTLVSDFGGLKTLIGIVAHELGHSNAGLKDIAEIKNIMHGVAEGNEGLRGRDLPLFYHPDRKEKQWAKMPGRS